MVARAGERRRLDVGQTQFAAGPAEPLELLRAPTSGPPGGGRRSAAGTGPTVAMDTPTDRRSARVETTSSSRLAQPDHEARLHGQAGVGRPGQHRQAAGVAGRGPHRPLQAGHGLDVVVEDVGTGVEDRVRAPRRRPCSPRSAARPWCRAGGPGWPRPWRPGPRRRRRPGRRGPRRSPRRGRAPSAPPPRPPVPARRGRGGAGARVSTRQKPQARVQREPLTMKVAVPSAQHSKMLGQPASSHTVTRPRSWTVRPRPRNSAPMRAGTRSHGRLAGAEGQARLRVDPGLAEAAQRAVARRKEPAAVGRAPADDGLAVVAGGRPTPRARRTTTRLARARSIGDRQPLGGAATSPGRSMPQGTMWPNMDRSQSTLTATPCSVRRRSPGAQRAHPHRRHLAEPAVDGPQPDARIPGVAPEAALRRPDPQAAQRVDDQLLEEVDVGRPGAGPSATSTTG